MDILDTLAALTGIRLVRDPLIHPDEQGVCTLDITGYRQTDSYSCGFSVAAMVVHTFHPRRSLPRLWNLVNPHPEKGTGDRALVKAIKASRIGVKERRDLGFNGIRKIIDEGFPIITVVETGDPEIAHWILIYGYGVNPSRVFIAGEGIPYFDIFFGRKNKEIKWSEFERSRWWRKGHGYVCWGQ